MRCKSCGYPIYVSSSIQFGSEGVTIIYAARSETPWACQGDPFKSHIPVTESDIITKILDYYESSR